MKFEQQNVKNKPNVLNLPSFQRIRVVYNFVLLTSFFLLPCLCFKFLMIWSNCVKSLETWCILVRQQLFKFETASVIWHYGTRPCNFILSENFEVERICLYFAFPCSEHEKRKDECLASNLNHYLMHLFV